MRLARILVLTHIRIRIIPLIQIAQRMIHLAMLALVCANVQKQVAHRSVAFGHVPVLDSDVGGGHFLPHGQTAGIDVGDFAGVGDYCFFFEVADEAVAGCGGEEVGEEEAVEEDALGA